MHLAGRALQLNVSQAITLSLRTKQRHRLLEARFSSAVMSPKGTGKRPWRFAPLNPEKQKNEAIKLRGIVFDVDGTLCECTHLSTCYLAHQIRVVTLKTINADSAVVPAAGTETFLMRSQVDSTFDGGYVH